MSIKDKIKNVFGRKNKRRDSELGAEEVVHEEVFPKKTAEKRNCGCGCVKSDKTRSTAKKPASKRTRPTNNDYQMIDPDNDTCDTSKS